VSDAAAIAARVRETKERIARAAERVGRDPGAICLIGAAKSMPVPAVRAAVAGGLTDVGENYVQEAAAVQAEIDLPVRWHLIGRLQRNKAARAAALFDVIHTVDRGEIGAVIAQHAAARGVVLPVLVEVNVAGEASKGGADPAALPALLVSLRGEPGIQVKGLMAIPPPSAPEVARRHFRRLRELRDEHQLSELSMGMSGDFEVAVEEGATMVRVGRAIFGDRMPAG
jgi:hypothetical protein